MFAAELRLLPGYQGKPGEMSENDEEMGKKKEDALAELKAGNDAHKKVEFDAAKKHHLKAMELDDEEILCITDRAAIHFRMEKYNECIVDCIRAEGKGQNLDAELRAKTLLLKGSAYIKLAKSAKDYDFAIEALVMACKIHENQDSLHELDYARTAKRELELREHSADVERESGNKCLEEKQIEEAVKHYTEAIKHNPSDAKAYSNRALCYTLCSRLAEGLKDAEKCLELDPKFVGGYLRKGDIEFQKKEYSKALETYEMGLKHGEEDAELLDAIKRCHVKMPPALERDTVKSKKANALLDPEIQSILLDPIIRQVLIDFQQNSSDAWEHAKNKLVLEKLQKLSDAGLL